MELENPFTCFDEAFEVFDRVPYVLNPLAVDRDDDFAHRSVPARRRVPDTSCGLLVRGWGDPFGLEPERVDNPAMRNDGDGLVTVPGRYVVDGIRPERSSSPRDAGSQSARTLYQHPH